MAQKKKPVRAKANRSAGQKSTGKSIVLIAAAVAAAVLIAVVWSFQGAETATTAVDPALLADAPPSRNVRGAENPAVTLVEYGDYSCPTCALFNPIVAELLRRMPSELELEFHHYPIPVGPHSVTAAVAAEAAGEQGLFWPMHDALYQTQSQWRDRDDARQIFISMAGQLGLDTDRFVEDLDSPELQGRVAADRRQGDRVGVSGTPSFFINGRRLNGLPQSVAEFEAVIRSVIGQ